MILRRSNSGIYGSIQTISITRRTMATARHCFSLPAHRQAFSGTKLPHRFFADTTDSRLSSSKLVIAQSAVSKLAALQARHPTKLLRVAVEGGGCHGFKYKYELEERDRVDAEEDALFTVDALQQTVQSKPSRSLSAGEADDSSGGRVMPVVVDSASLELLSGSTLVYTEELIGRQFAISGNSIADSGCGCGVSFGRKFV